MMAEKELRKREAELLDAERCIQRFHASREGLLALERQRKLTERQRACDQREIELREREAALVKREEALRVFLHRIRPLADEFFKGALR